MFGKSLVKKAVAGAAAAAAAFVAVIALGGVIFYALCLVVVPLAAAAITLLIFAVAAAAISAIFLGAPEAEDEDYDEPEGLGARAFSLFRQRPILGTVAALAGGWIFLRNPALATMVAAAFTEKPHGPARRRR